MLKKITSIAGWYLAAIALANILAGCSVVGFTGGAILDEAVGENAEAESWRIDSFRKGKTMTIYLKDGSSIHGKYKGLYEIDSIQYAIEYSQSDPGAEHHINLPQLNDTIDIVIGKKTYQQNCFQGFGYKYRDYPTRNSYTKKAQCFYLNAGSYEQPSGKRFYLHEVDEVINLDGSSNRGYVFTNYLSNGNIPLLSEVNILTAQGMEQVPLGEIDYVKYSRKNGKWTGLALGLAVDLVILLWILSEFSIYGDPVL